MKFYRCKKCGKIIAVVNETPVPTMCCGEAMEELIPGVVDAALEKHVPFTKLQTAKLRLPSEALNIPCLMSITFSGSQLRRRTAIRERY